jgi:hypothetical protein
MDRNKQQSDRKSGKQPQPQSQGQGEARRPRDEAGEEIGQGLQSEQGIAPEDRDLSEEDQPRRHGSDKNQR